MTKARGTGKYLMLGTTCALGKVLLRCLQKSEKVVAIYTGEEKGGMGALMAANFRLVFEEHELHDTIVVSKFENVVAFELDVSLFWEFTLVVIEEGAVGGAEVHQVAAYVTPVAVAINIVVSVGSFWAPPEL